MRPQLTEPLFGRRGFSFSRCTVARMSRQTAQPMIEAHYLHKWPAVVLLTLGLWLDYEPLGVIVFADPPRETSIRYGGKTWELARLWVSDDCPRNSESWFIARAVKFIKREHREVECLVSYADPSVGHVGIIYRASNWQSDGMSEIRSDVWVGPRRFGRAGDVQGKDAKRLEKRPRKHRYYLRLRRNFGTGQARP